MRLQKYLASCGVASRRAAEKLMADGRVTVDGQVVSQMGAQVEPGQDVRVDGRPVRPEAEKRCIMYHKPAGDSTKPGDVFKKITKGRYPPGGRRPVASRGQPCFSAAASLTQRHSTLAACSRSEREGKVGAMRMFRSSGSLP